VRILKRGLEQYSRTDEGALYTFEWHVDGEVVRSPMNQDPLLLVPHEARARSSAPQQEGKREYRSRSRASSIPVSRWWYAELMARYEGDWTKRSSTCACALRALREGPRRHRHLPAQGREEPGLDRAHRRHQLPPHRGVRLGFRSARVQLRRRVQRREPRAARVHRGAQARRRVPVRPARRDAGALDQAEEVRADLDRRGDHRAHQRARVQEARRPTS
jgi:hypothetical protein